MTAMTDDLTDDAELTYAHALSELDDLLTELEDETLDVDTLSERVDRAAFLIRFCRERITSARTTVEQIVAELDELAHEPDDRDDAT